MIPNNQFWFNNGGVIVYDTDALNYFNTVPNSFNSAEKNQINNLFTALKAGSNNYSKIDKLILTANISKPNAKLDIKAPALNPATEINGGYINWDRGGFTNWNNLGQNSAIDTNFIPATHGVNFQLNDGCYFYWSNTNASADNYYDAGTYDAGSGQSYSNALQFNNKPARSLMSTTTPEGVVITNSIGLFSIVKSGTTLSLYINGVLNQSTSITSAAGLALVSFYITNINISGSPGTVLSQRQIALVGFGSGTINQLELYNSVTSYINYMYEPVYQGLFIGQSNCEDNSTISGNLPLAQQAQMSKAYSTEYLLGAYNVFNFYSGYNVFRLTTNGTKYGVTTPFAYKLSNTYNRKTYIGNPSLGGTSLTNPGSGGALTWHPANGSSLLPNAITNYFNYYYTRNSVVRPFVVLCQGEQDSDTLVNANNNNSGLLALISKMRDTVGNGGTGVSNLKIITCVLVSNNGFESTINSFRADIANPLSPNYVPGVYYLDDSALVSTYDGVHLTPASLIIRGELLADLVDSIF